MSELTLTIIKLGFLAVLWLFVLSTVSVIRTDLFGSRTPSTGKARKPAKPKSKPAKAPRKPKGAPAMVMVVQGANAGFHLPLGQTPLTIGRGNDVEIFVDDEYVSTRHAVLRPHSDRWYVEDLGSTNGTFVGESRIHGPTPVGFGTPFRVGKTVLELRK